MELRSVASGLEGVRRGWNALTCRDAFFTVASCSRASCLTSYISLGCKARPRSLLTMWVFPVERWYSRDVPCARLGLRHLLAVGPGQVRAALGGVVELVAALRAAEHAAGPVRLDALGVRGPVA